MKFTLAVALSVFATAAATFVHATKGEESDYVPHRYRGLQTATALAIPTQTYFVPLPDASLHNDVLSKINLEHGGRLPLTTTHILVFTIATEGTVIWYDHWEDGYDVDVTAATARTTLIWGDGNATNGCGPHVTSCTNANDILRAGNRLTMQNNIEIATRTKSTILFDGGDRIQSSFPISVTRAGHPSHTAVLASALQVMDTSQWGTKYEAPVGTDFIPPGSTSSTTPFEFSILMFQAATVDTVVTLPNLTNIVLMMGESRFISVKLGDQITSDKPIQVVLLTGDIDLVASNSKPETRWYGLRPISQASNSYITPVGDTIGKSRMIIYNPNSDLLTYTMRFLQDGKLTTTTGTVNSKKAVYSPIVPYNSGAIFESTHNFLALTITDSEQTDSRGTTTWGATYDWGYSAVPTDMLSPEVLVGLGWECLHNSCMWKNARTIGRSVVWITPVEDADIYIDFTNTGGSVTPRFARALSSIRVGDPTDRDMSGASIYATKPNTTNLGDPVDIAVAWGQDPTLAITNNLDWELTMDMGTAVLPLSSVNIAKLVDKPIVKAGEELEYTIRITNSGQRTIRSNTVSIKDVLDPEVTYIPNSMVTVSKAGVITKIPDATSGTPFIFDEAGYRVPFDLSRRGFVVDYIFKVKVNPTLKVTKEVIVNNGSLVRHFDGNSEVKYGVTTTIDYAPSIKVDNTVVKGGDSSLCEYGDDMLSGRNGTQVVYCFNITNNGNSYLSGINVTNGVLSYSNTSIFTLAPGESKIVAVTSMIGANMTNTVTVSGTPSLLDGTAIYGKSIVNASDPSNVVLKAGIDGDVKSGTKSTCMQNKWTDSGKGDSLLCTSKEIYVEALAAATPAKCTLGETITISIDAGLFIGGPRKDVAWYVASDGGDALNGTCVVDGLDDSYDYKVVDVVTGSAVAGMVKYSTTDSCGDIVLGTGNSAAKMTVPLLVNTTLACADDNEDGYLDFAVCFNWKPNGSTTNKCTIGSALPDTKTGCYCTRLDVGNVDVLEPKKNVVQAC